MSSFYNFLCESINILKLIGLVLIIFTGIFIFTKNKIFLTIIYTLLAIVIFALVPFYFTFPKVSHEFSNINTVSNYDNIKECVNVTNKLYLFVLPIIMFTTLFYILIYIFVEKLRNIKTILLFILTNLLIFLYHTYYYFKVYLNFLESELKIFEQYYN